nr:hypothetical protein [Micromonospora sp. DSM 115978]
QGHARVAERLPFADASVALLLDVFAPRNAVEMARVLHPEGRMLVVTPGPDHLAAVTGPLGLVGVDDRKDDRLDAVFAGNLVRTSREPLTYPMRLGSAEIVDLVLMGPAGHHTDGTRLRADVRSRWPDGVDVAASFVVSSYTIPTSTVQLNC